MSDGLIIDRIAYRRLQVEDAAMYRILWLEALHLAPQSFGSSWDDEQTKGSGHYVSAIERNTIFGAVDDTNALQGAAGFYMRPGAKLRHKAVMFGLFVTPYWRGKGIGRALVERVIHETRGSVEALQLTVSTRAEPARLLYAACGFQQYGLERCALKVGGEYVDEYLMELTFDDR